jgi:DNA-binding Lrp family transcriptional regulator
MIGEKFEMDDIDQEIIKLIQKEPNITHTEIAEHVNRSQPTVGMRIKRLEDAGLLQFQAGLNLRAAKDFYLAKIELKTNRPDEMLQIVEKCPFMLNAFRLSGDFNVSVILASRKLTTIDKIVNEFFRDNEIVLTVRMDIINDVLDDFVLPIDMDFENCDCPLKKLCILTEEELANPE